jgi:hypothetical protein
LSSFLLMRSWWYAVPSFLLTITSVSGYSWHVAPQPRAERDRPLADAASWCTPWTDHNQRSTASTRSKLCVLRLFPKSSERWSTCAA